MLYMDEDSKSPSLLLSMVCYADVLGFRNMTKDAFESDKGMEFLRKVNRSLNLAYKDIRGYAKPGDWGGSMFDVKFFTDDIVVGYPLYAPDDYDGEPELGNLMTLFARAQASLASDGFFPPRCDYHGSTLPK